MDNIITISVNIPSKEGFIGRACNNPDCKQYFKIGEDSYSEKMYCPYCGDSFNSKELLTTDQVNHVNDVAKQEALEYMQKQIQDMLKKTLGSSSSKRTGITYKPGKIQKKIVRPLYEEREVDSEIMCPECNTKFQVYGVFGFCPGCREENLIIYEANIKIIKSEISSSSSPERQLRHAYNDLVSTFEKICLRKASKVSDQKVNFQVLFDARRFFNKYVSVDILENLDQDKLLALRRLFQKRHLYTHSDGIINEQYIKKIPEDVALLGGKALLSVSEFEMASSALRIAIGDLVKSLEAKG
ncbi:hypothetical protein [Aeromonas veronii]|uniref:hypothetical protein n=1 Tax=Aeromonas veronii TaxID=654 RepID=UPI003D224999